MSPQELYDDAMFDFSQGEFDTAIAKFEEILAQDPAHFDAQLSLGMAHYRKGDFARAIAEGHKAEKLKPHEQLVHTNLSLFYMKSGDKTGIARMFRPRKLRPLKNAETVGIGLARTVRLHALLRNEATD